MSAPDEETEESRRTDRFSRLSALFDQAADLPPDEQQALLDAECADDPVLRAEVEQLLADDARLGAPGADFLRSPVRRAADESTHPATPSVRPESVLPSHLCRYRVIRLIGEGGMGAVYEAEQDSPRRTVALKVVRPGLASASLLTRFRHESQILGRLHHPGIAQVYEAGVAADGQPFFAMEFIRGLPLNEYARVRTLTLPGRLELLARVCDAVQHAHDHGIIHRDLKPANILVEETGQPKVLDFGVARSTDADLLTAAGLTQTGQLLGTPNFMSPEQVTGEPAAIDRRADVYALGVILFELATRRLPYRLENLPLADTVRTILEEDAPRAGSLNPELRGDVETIVAKALEKDRARRYASAADMAADIRRYLGDEPILARPPSNLYQLRKFARRHRALVGGVLATVAALVVGLVGTIIFAVAEARQRGEAEKNLTAANQEKREAQYQLYRASLYAASAAMENRDVADAAGHLDAAPERLRRWEWRHLSSRLDDSSSVLRLPNLGPGFLLAGPDQLGIGALTSNGLRITDRDGNERERVPIGPEKRRLVSVTQTLRGVRIAAWADNTAFELLDGAGKVLCRIATPENKDYEPAAVTVSPDGRWLACRTDGAYHRFAVFDAVTGKRAAICSGHSGTINALAFTPDSTRVVSGSVDRTARLWDAATGKLLATFQGHTSTVESTRFSPDSAQLVTSSADGTVRQWNVRTGQPVGPPYTGHSGALFTAAYSPDGQLVASAGEDRVIRVWRATDQEDVALLFGHTFHVFELAFDPGGHRLASRSDRREPNSPGDGTARIWDIDAHATVPVLHGHTGAVYPVACSPDGRWIASGSSDRTVRLWDAATGEPCAILPHPADVRGLAFGPDGTWLITGNTFGGRLRIWDVATARVRKEIWLHGEKARFSSLTLSGDGKRVAATTEDLMFRNHRLTVIDIESGNSLFSTDGINLAYSPDGRWLAVLEPDLKTVLLLDAQTYQSAARFRGHEGTVQKAAFSPDGRTLATCSLDRTIRLWQVEGAGLTVESKKSPSRSKLDPSSAKVPLARQDSPPSTLHHPSSTREPATHEPSAVLRGHTDLVYSATFLPDGSRLATAGRDGVVWLWDLSRGKEVARLRAHSGFVWALAFTPDGATLVSGSGNGTVRLWDTAPLKTRHQARREAAALQPEAERLVDQLVDRLQREKNDLAQVADALRADRGLREPLRHAAIRAVLRRSQTPTAHTGNPRESD